MRSLRFRKIKWEISWGETEVLNWGRKEMGKWGFGGKERGSAGSATFLNFSIRHAKATKKRGRMIRKNG